MSSDFISGVLLAWMMAALWWLGMILWMWFHRDRPLEPAPKNEPDPEPDLSDRHLQPDEEVWSLLNEDDIRFMKARIRYTDWPPHG